MSLFSFLGKVANTVGHDVSTVAHGNSAPGGGVFGFLNQSAQQIVNPISKVANEGVALGQAVTGNLQGAQRTLTPGGGLGHQGGVLGGAETGPGVVFIGPNAGTNIAKTVGTGASIASNIVAPTFGFLQEGSLAARAAKGALFGSGVGAVGGVGAGLESGQVNPKQILLGAAGGAALGGLAPVAGAAIHQFATAPEIGAIGKDVSAVPKPEDIHIPTNAGTIRISPDELNNLAKAQTPEAVKSIIGDALPQEITDRIAPGLALAKDPNIIQNLISKGVNDTLPRPPAPVVGNEIAPPSVSEPVNPAGQGALDNLAQSPAAKQITDTLAAAQQTRSLQEQGYSAERSARLGQSQAAGADLPGLAGHRAELSALKGELGKQQYEGLSGHLSPTEQDNLFTQLRQEVKDNPNIQGYAKLNTAEAARKVIYGDSGVPTNSELGLLRNAFGENFSDAVKGDITAHNERLSALQTLGQKATQVAGLPRELMATADFSGGLRQGLAAATRHPLVFAKAFGSQFKYFAKESAYHDAEKAIYDHPDYNLLHQSGTAILELDKKLGPTEEKFVSNLGEKIPGVGRLIRASNRAYTGLLNNMRANIFYDKVATLRNAGYDLNSPENAKLVKDLGTVINTSTGRGDLGRFETAGHALSTALFAPRLIASRLSMLDPRYYINLDPIARREALTTLASLGAFGTGILSLAELMGAKVSKDPTNADFGKARLGDTRIDPLGGFAQYIRLGAQLAEGKKTNSTTGATTELGKGIAGSRWDVFTNFIANKEAPVPSFVTTALKGKDAAGNPIDYKKEVLSRFTPLLAQDIHDLYSHDNAVGGSAIGKPLTAVAGAFGAGLQTYSAQDNPLSTKQKTYVDALKQSGADQSTIKASTSFFQTLKEASGTRTNVNTAVDKAIASKDLPKAQQLADQYNKELAAGMTKWAQQYGEQYGNSDLQQAYNRQKINLTPGSVQSRIKALTSNKPF